MKARRRQEPGKQLGGGASPGIFCPRSHRSQHNRMGATLAWLYRTVEGPATLAQPYRTVEGTNVVVRHHRAQDAARFYPEGGAWLRVSGSETNWFRSPV